MASASEPHPKRNGRLRIPLRFDDALKAAMEVKRPEDAKKKRPARKRS
jgi:hypothetical protein